MATPMGADLTRGYRGGFAVRQLETESSSHRLKFHSVSAPQATIASDFLAFDTAGGSTATNGNLGKVDFVLLDPDGAGGATAPFDKTGTPIAIIADLVGATSSFTLSGSFDTATDVQFGTTDTSCASLVVFGTVYSAVIAADRQSVLVTGITAAGRDLFDNSAICYVVSGTQEVAATPGYSATTAGSTIIAGTAGTLADGSGSLSGLTREGSTASIDVLTTFSDYNQRIIITNRSTIAAAYEIRFLTEPGVTAVAGPAATGTIPAGAVLALRATDVVTLIGGTRCSATLTIEANSAFVAATTQTVNLNDSGTDTVFLVFN